MGQGQGRAVPAKGARGDDVAPLYLGDDITDEDAFRALSDKGIGIFVGQADDPEIGGRGTSAAFVVGRIETFCPEGRARGSGEDVPRAVESRPV